MVLSTKTVQDLIDALSSNSVFSGLTQAQQVAVANQASQQIANLYNDAGKSDYQRSTVSGSSAITALDPYVNANVYAGGLTDALNDASNVGKTVVVSDAQSLNAYTQTTAVGIKVVQGGSIALTGASTLIKNFEAPLAKVLSGTGTVKFSALAVTWIHPEWWGAAADGTTDSTAAINAALASVDYGMTVKLLSGTYVTTGAIAPSVTFSVTHPTMTTWGTALEGVGGIYPTRIQNNGTDYSISFDASGGADWDFILKNISFYGTATSKSGIYINSGHKITAEKCAFNFHGTHGAELYNAWTCTFEDCDFMYNGQGSAVAGFQATSATHNLQLKSCRIFDGTGDGLYVDTTCNGITVIAPDIENNVGNGVLIGGVSAFQLLGGYIENNQGTAQVNLNGQLIGGVVMGVYFHGTGSSAIGLRMQNVQGVVVKGNRFTGHTSESIWLGASATGNEIGPNSSNDPTYITAANSANIINDQFGSTSPAFYAPAVNGGSSTPTYGTTVAIDLSLGNQFYINVTDGVGFTMGNPSNQLAGMAFSLIIRNNSGGAMGTITWGNNYKRDTSYANPATGTVRIIRFRVQAAGECIQEGTVSGDITY